MIAYTKINTCIENQNVLLENKIGRFESCAGQCVFTMRPSTRCGPSSRSGSVEMTRKYSVLWGDICLMKTLGKESFSRIAKFYEIEGVILETEQKMYASFGRERAFHSTTVSEILQTMHENDLFDMLPEFSNVVHFLVVIPATSCSAEQSFSACAD